MKLKVYRSGLMKAKYAFLLQIMPTAPYIIVMALKFSGEPALMRAKSLPTLAISNQPFSRRKFLPKSAIAEIIGKSVLPNSVIEYSVFGGTTGKTSR